MGVEPKTAVLSLYPTGLDLKASKLEGEQGEVEVLKKENASLHQQLRRAQREADTLRAQLKEQRETARAPLRTGQVAAVVQDNTIQATRAGLSRAATAIDLAQSILGRFSKNQ